jgi:diguanylate cyclase (GGDEF)-like protein
VSKGGSGGFFAWKYDWRGVRMLMAWFFVLAVTRHADGQAISLASFTQLQGLGSLEDNCLIQDHDGFVYVCTEHGLFRFDGHMFQRIGAESGLRSSNVAALHEDAAGRLWVGTRTALYAGGGQHFAPVADQAQHPLPIDFGATLADLDSRLYAVSRHRLWVVEQAGTAWRVRPRFDPRALDATPVLKDINSVYSDGHALWFGCGKSLCQLSGDQLHVWGEREGIPADTWASCVRARDGTLWARSARYIRALPAGATAFANRDLPGARVVTVYLDMIEDAQGRLLTRANNGLARWDGQHWQIFGTDNGLPDIGIDALLYDRNRVLWMGTYGRGVLQWRGYDRMQSWQAVQGLDSSPTWTTARASDGTLWIGDELGGSVLAPGALRLMPWPLKPPPLAQETIGLHALPDGDMLVVYYSGELLRYHARQRTTEEIAHSPAYIRQAEVDRSGRVWLCTERGIYVYDGHSLQRAGAAVVPDNAFSDAKEDAQGRLWFSGEAGLFRFAHGQWARVHVTGTPSDQDFTHMDVLPSGDLYLAGNFDGLWHGRATDSDVLNVQHVSDDLLDDTRIYYVRHDRRGWLWTGGTDGVELFNGHQWRRLTEDDGLIWDDIGENAFYQDNDGSIWVGTSNGITHILVPDSLSAPDPLKVMVTGISLDDVPQAKMSAYRFADASEKSITFHLATLGAPTRSTLQYRYRLRGLEHDWVTLDGSQVDYPPLSPGNFVFEVAAYNPDSRQLSPVVQVPMQIVPPWWQRPPAILAGLLLLTAAIVLAWQIRTRQLRMRANALEQIVASRTRELEVDKQALEEARAALWQQATHDALTGLPNRSRILEILGEAITHAREHGQPLALALLDLDHFKDINDRYGHLAGDAVLIEASARLRDTVPPGASVGRYGGEELLVVMPGIVSGDPEPFETLRQHIAGSPFGGDGVRMAVTCSAGVTWLQAQDRDGFDLIRRADVALYTAKTSGRNRVVMTNGNDERA